MHVHFRIRYCLLILLINPFSWIQAQTGSIFSQPEVVITLKTCSGSALACLGDIIPSTISDFAFTLDGSAYTGPFPVCKQDTLSIYSYEFLFGKGNSGPYRLDSWVVNGKMFSGQFPQISALVDSMNVWDPLGNWQLVPAAFQIRGGMPSSTYSQMLLTVLSINTPAVMGHNISFTTKALGIPVFKGVHQLVALDQQTGDIDTLLIVAGCNSFDQQRIQTEIGLTGQACLDVSELTGSMTAVQNQCVAPDYPASMAQWDLMSGCVSWTGLAIGTDTVCLTACDQYGFCTSTNYLIEVLYPGALSAIQVAVHEGDTLLFCPDLTGLPGNSVSMKDLCEDGSGIHATVVLQSGQMCVQIIGQTFGGPEYVCLEICDDQGICDTITLEIHVLFQTDQDVFLQTGLFFDEEFCPDISAFPGVSLTMNNVCPGQSGGSTTIQFDPMTMCLSFFGFQPGIDTVCLVIEDEFGNQALTTIRIEVVAPETALDTILLDVGDQLTYCPDFSELSGNVLSTVNNCPLVPDSPLSLVIDPQTACVMINGLEVGTTQLCLVTCNEYGVCDTMYVVVNVTQPVSVPLPVAVQDAAETVINQNVNISVLLNDLVGSSAITVGLVSGFGPSNGTVFVEQNGSITYSPNEQYCGLDQFAYQLCNQSGCDTALVSIEISCEVPVLLIPYSGFSPNGDGINEYFAIEGLDAFPRNTLEVYNRWGNRIFMKTDYQGNWDGTWGGLVLPDGTYFYILKPEGHPVLSGYVHLHR